MRLSYELVNNKGKAVALIFICLCIIPRFYVSLIEIACYVSEKNPGDSIGPVNPDLPGPFQILFL